MSRSARIVGGMMATWFAWSGSAQAALTLSAPQTMKQGLVASFGVTGATPGATVALVAGPIGAGPCPPQIRPLCLGVKPPTVLASEVADAAGNASFVDVPVPESLTWGPKGVQAIHGGPTPQVSTVATVAVLQEYLAGGLEVHDLASYLEARFTWRIPDNGWGRLQVVPGAPARMDLPYLEELCEIFIYDGAGVQLTAPALTAVDRVILYGKPGVARDVDVVLPSAVEGGPCGGGGRSIWIEGHEGSATLDMPLWSPDLEMISISGNSGAVSLAAPSVTTVSGLGVFLNTNAGPVNVDLAGLAQTSHAGVAKNVTPIDLGGVFPSLVSAGDVVFWDNQGWTTLDAFPALRQVVTSVVISDNPDLVAVTGFGAPGLVIGNLLDVSGNPALRSLSGLAGLHVPPASAIRCNPELSSCEAARYHDAGPYSCSGNILDECSDEGTDECYPAYPAGC